MPENIAVIDTETNWSDEVMSIGVVIADTETLEPKFMRYYILTPAYTVDGMYSRVLYLRDNLYTVKCSAEEAASDLCRSFAEYGVEKLFAYNARFDATHLKGLSHFAWYDIMRIAAYRPFNSKIPCDAPCCKTGRLKRNYGVEAILQMLLQDASYREVHNALCDAVDELKIMRLLEVPIEHYAIARI